MYVWYNNLYQKFGRLELTTSSGLVPSGWTNGHGLVTLLAKLFSSQCQFLFGKVVDFQALHDGPLLVGQGDGEAEHDALGGTVATVRENSHADKFTCKKSIFLKKNNSSKRWK